MITSNHRPSKNPIGREEEKKESSSGSSSGSSSDSGSDDSEEDKEEEPVKVKFDLITQKLLLPFF